MPDTPSQLIVYRLTTANSEAILVPPTFEASANLWRRYQRKLSEGGYVVWWNRDTVWRRSAFQEGRRCLLDEERAWGIARAALGRLETNPCTHPYAKGEVVSRAPLTLRMVCMTCGAEVDPPRVVAEVERAVVGAVYREKPNERHRG